MMQKKRQGYHYVCRWYRNDFFGSQPFFGGLWSASSEIRASTLCPGSYPTVVLGLVGPWPVPFSLRNDAISGPKSLQFTEISWCSSLAAKFSWPSPTDSNHLWNLALIWCSTVDLVDDKIQQLIQCMRDLGEFLRSSLRKASKNYSLVAIHQNGGDFSMILRWVNYDQFQLDRYPKWMFRKCFLIPN